MPGGPSERQIPSQIGICRLRKDKEKERKSMSLKVLGNVSRELFDSFVGDNGKKHSMPKFLDDFIEKYKLDFKDSKIVMSGPCFEKSKDGGISELWFVDLRGNNVYTLVFSSETPNEIHLHSDFGFKKITNYEQFKSLNDVLSSTTKPNFHFNNSF